MSCSHRVIFSHSRENDSIITVLFPDCKEYCYINMIYQNHIYGEKFMIQNYILLFFEYNLQKESTPGSSRKAPEKACPQAIFRRFKRPESLRDCFLCSSYLNMSAPLFKAVTLSFLCVLQLCQHFRDIFVKSSRKHYIVGRVVCPEDRSGRIDVR